MVFQLNIPSIMFWAFSEVYFPKLTTMVSLVNLPTKKAGIIYKGFILAMPPAKNNGVVGSGNKE